MSPGMRVKISRDAAPFYRKQATSLEGTVVGLSRSGEVARVHLDDVADSYVRTTDLAPLER
jgi:hypothetical protein